MMREILWGYTLLLGFLSLDMRCEAPVAPEPAAPDACERACDRMAELDVCSHAAEHLDLACVESVASCADVARCTR